MAFRIKKYCFLVFATCTFIFFQKVNAQVANLTVDNPAPFGGKFGTVGGGVAYQSRTRIGENADANAGFSVGLGDYKKYAGLSLNFNIFGLSPTIGEDDNFLSGAMDLMVNRMVTPYVFVGGGVRSLVKWKSPELRARNNRSFFFTSSFIIPFSRQYTKPLSLFFVTAGVGNGVFRLKKDFDLRTSGKFNVFGSMALQIFRGSNVILEWNGYEINSGISVYPFKKIPALGGTFAVADLISGRLRYIVTVGYAFQLSNKITLPNP